MPISFAQLKYLADEYMFDYNEALRFLGVEQKTPRSSKPKEPKVPKKNKDVPIPGFFWGGQTTKVNEPKKRGPSGYNIYVSQMSPSVKNRLARSLSPGEKLPPRAVSSQVSTQWKMLSDAQRALWNERAKQNN